MFLIHRLRFRVILILLSASVGVVLGQGSPVSVDLGAFVGGSYYFGDTNPREQFYQPSPSVGGLLKVNLNPFQTARFQWTYGSLRLNAHNYLTGVSGHYQRAFANVQVGMEYHFLPHLVAGYNKPWTPYIFGSVGWTFRSTAVPSAYQVPEYSLGNKHNFNIPFGLGVKYRATQRLTVGAEWTWVKTFDDTLDFTQNPGPSGSASATHNNDWYGFAGFFVTYRLFQPKTPCPAYN